jgi:ABC-type antimicrobial peptide transport system permease subunit
LHRFDKYTLRTLGFALVVLGILLFLVAVLGGPGIMHCPANGCPPLTFQEYLVGILVFFSSIALIIAGIILLIVARKMKPRQETNAST